MAPGVVKLAGRELQEWLRPLNRPELVPYARFELERRREHPARGPCILVFNHRSYFDGVPSTWSSPGPAAPPAASSARRRSSTRRSSGGCAKAFGGIRVVRASGSDEPLEAAAQALRAGELISMSPQGTIPRGPAFFDPVLKGRWGAARLAAATKAPVIPVGLWSTESVWPRNSRLPRLSLSEPPEVQVRVGDAVPLRYRSPDADTKRIMSALMDLLPAEARVPKNPTHEELLATFPPGYEGDPTLEVARRPGTDT